MTGELFWILNLLGLAVVLVRRRTVAIALLAAQSLLLGGAAVSHIDGSLSLLFVALAIGVGRGIVLPVLLLRVVRHTREAGRLSTERPPFLRLLMAVVIVAVCAALIPPFGLEYPGAEQAVMAMLTCGIVVAALRRAVVFQAVGFLIAENGIYLAGLAVPGGIPGALELALLFDLIVVLTVVAAFGSKIFQHFGTSDTTILRDLHD